MDLPLYQLKLLGPPQFLGPAGPIRIPAVKSAALLWYLAAHADRGLTRPHLAALLWGHGREEQARNSLRTALIRLRKALPLWPLRSVGDTLVFSGAANLGLDVASFRDLPSPQVENRSAMWKMLALRRGPFLDGVAVPNCEPYAEWLEQERLRWDQRYLTLLDRLIPAEDMAGNWPAVLEAARMALAIDPFQERFQRWLMRAHYQMGDRAAALTQFQVYRRLIQTELGVDASAETIALHEAIAAEDLARSHPAIEMAAADLSTTRSSPWHPPLVGRDEDLARLRKTLAEAAGTGKRVALLAGEAGSGKTRLMEAVTAAAPFRTQLTGRCYEEFRHLPYAPFVEALRQGLDPQHLAALDLPAVWLAEVRRLLPDLISPPDGESADADKATEDADILGQQQRLFEGLAQLMAALPGPLLLVLEDIHWADPATLLLVSYLARKRALGTTALLLTARSGSLTAETEHLLKQLQREGRLAWQPLPLLTPAAIAELVAAISGHDDARVSARLFAKSRGNPLFAVELLRAQRQSAAGADADQLESLPIPSTIQEVIRGRLHHLDPLALRLLTVASIFPGGVSLTALHRVAALNLGQAGEAVDRLIRSGLLTESPSSAAAAEGRLQFSHDLYRDVLRGDVSQTHRLVLHQQAFAALREAGALPPAQQAEQLAFHATLGGLWQEGLRWNQAAAAIAEQASAFDAAVRFYDQALECLQRLPRTPEQRRLAVDLRVQMARVGHFFQPERQHTWLRPAATEAAALDDPDRLAEVWLAQSNAFTVQGMLARAQQVFTRLLPYARSNRRPALLAPALTFMGLMHAIRGEYDRADAVLGEAIPVADALGVRLFCTAARTFRTCVHAARGQFDEAEALIQPLVTLHRGLTDEALLGHVLTVAAVTAHFRGCWAEAAHLGLEAQDHARSAGHRLHEYVASTVPGLPLARCGDPAGGLQVQEQAAALARRARTTIFLDNSYAWLGEICLTSGRWADAETAAWKGLQIARTKGYRLGEALAEKVLGKISAARGDRPGARAWLRSALARFEALGARPDAARCLAMLAEVAENSAESRQHAQQASDAFGVLGMDWQC